MKRAICAVVLATASLAACEIASPLGAWDVAAPLCAGSIAEEPASDEISMPPWAESGPKASDYFRVYPLQARRLGIESEVRLLCTIRDDRRLDCKRHWEEYPDMGFDVAGLAVSNLFVVKRSDDPKLQPGNEVILPVSFRLVD